MILWAHTALPKQRMDAQSSSTCSPIPTVDYPLSGAYHELALYVTNLFGQPPALARRKSTLLATMENSAEAVVHNDNDTNVLIK